MLQYPVISRLEADRTDLLVEAEVSLCWEIGFSRNPPHSKIWAMGHRGLDYVTGFVSDSPKPLNPFNPTLALQNLPFEGSSLGNLGLR